MQQRLDHIHGLRGAAALVVVFQHAAQMVNDAGNDIYRPLLETINLGRFGVVLFFMISGLVIPFSFRGETPLRSFVISRIFRLFPVYWLSIPVLAYIGLYEYGWELGFDALVANIFMVQGFVGEANIGPGYWTLKFEVLFYLLTGLLFWRRLLGDASLNGIFVMVCLMVSIQPIVAGLVFGQPVFIWSVPYLVAMFFLGMLLRRHYVEGCENARRWAMVLVPFAIVTGVATSGFVFPAPDNGNPYLAPLPLALGMALPIPVLILILWRKPAAPNWVMYLGTVSYSAYLFQDVGLIWLRYVLPPAQWPAIYVLAVIGLTVGIASLTYRFVERPAIDLGRRLSQRSRVKARRVAA